MGTLVEFRDYLTERREVIKTIETELCTLQEKYETFFQEVTRVREAELEQLRNAIHEGLELPPKFRLSLHEAHAEAKELFELELTDLRDRRDAQEKLAESTRQEAAHAERMLRAENADLDGEEEELKARVSEMMTRIRAHNEEIREMGKGFGFFFKLPAMQRIRKKTRALEAEQKDVAAQIEVLRRRWLDVDAAHIREEQEREDLWKEYATEAAGLQAKLAMLESARERMLERSALEQALYALRPDLPEASPSDPPCPRCGAANPSGYHFCRVCAVRLGDDRADVVGSLDEVAELNLHHARFSEGMQACQSLIGLIRGLKTGIDAFFASVVDMLASQNRHSLAVLQLSVPEAAVAYATCFDEVATGLQQVDHHMHPIDFAAKVERLIAGHFTEAQIQGWFEEMGEMLSAAAEAQW